MNSVRKINIENSRQNIEYPLQVLFIIPYAINAGKSFVRQNFQKIAESWSGEQTLKYHHVLNSEIRLE